MSCQASLRTSNWFCNKLLRWLSHQELATPAPSYFKSKVHIPLYSSVSKNTFITNVKKEKLQKQQFRCCGLQHQHLPGHLSHWWSIMRSQFSSHIMKKVNVPKDPLALFMLRAGVQNMQWCGCEHVSVFSNSVLFPQSLHHISLGFCFSAHQAFIHLLWEGSIICCHLDAQLLLWGKEPTWSSKHQAESRILWSPHSNPTQQQIASHAVLATSISTWHKLKSSEWNSISAWHKLKSSEWSLN